MPSIRPRHGAVEKLRLLGQAWQGLEYLQFGHGTEPWRNIICSVITTTTRPPSIRPRHGAVEKLQHHKELNARRSSFNSATARSRGETTATDIKSNRDRSFNSATARSRGETYIEVTDMALNPDLQFGHGTEPWRNHSSTKSVRRIKNLQFGHGTEPWRNTLTL